jgi:aspartyl-tRNA(Asn)/glutamyl-tRNA(Gln) amidotransferase subunit C
MSFSRQEVDALARLARLSLSDDEHALVARQLAEIVDYARQVGDVDTSGLAGPLAAASAAPLRVDAVQPSLDRADVTGAAPDADPAAGLITVPRVLG